MGSIAGQMATARLMAKVDSAEVATGFLPKALFSQLQMKSAVQP
jgi:hypothetical protein